jgi:hypothetical protein
VKKQFEEKHEVVSA